MELKNGDWEIVAVMLQSWGAPAWNSTTDKAYRMELNDCDPLRLAQAIKYVGNKNPDHFRPSAWELKAAYDQLAEPGAPNWTRAERMAVKAVTRRTRLDGENWLRKQEGGHYVLGWLSEYGWQRFATEPQDSYTYNAQRKSYEECIAQAREGEAVQRALGPSGGAAKEVGQARRLDPSQALPRGSEGVRNGTASPRQDAKALDF